MGVLIRIWLLVVSEGVHGGGKASDRSAKHLDAVLANLLQQHGYAGSISAGHRMQRPMILAGGAISDC